MTDTSSTPTYCYVVSVSTHADKKGALRFEDPHNIAGSRGTLLKLGLIGTVHHSATRSDVQLISNRLEESIQSGRILSCAVDRRYSLSASWLKEASRTLVSLAAGESKDAPTTASYSTAQLVLEQLHVANLKPSRIVGTAEAGIAFYFFAKQRMATIECFETGEIAFLTQVSNLEPDAWDVEAEVFSLQKSVRQIAEFVTVVNHDQLLATS